MGKTGRPEEDDSEPLYAMAEIVDQNPEMNLTSVIRIVMQSMASFHSEEAIIKRLRRKFTQHREFLIDRIRARKERPVFYLPPNRSLRFFDFSAPQQIGDAMARSITPEMQQMGERIAQMNKQFNTPKMQRMQERIAQMNKQFNTPEMRRMQERIAQMNEQFNTPKMRRMQERIAQMNEQFNTPEMQRMQERMAQASRGIKLAVRQISHST